MSTLEIIAALVSFVGVALGITGKRITWPWWSISSILYGILFIQWDLFASAALQLVFITAAIAGWFGWGKTGAIPGPLKNSYRIYTAAAIIIATLALAPILESVKAASTYVDAILLFGSIAAQFLMVYEKYESWTLWLVVDLGYTALYFNQELYLTSALYLVFTIIAAVGWRSWYATFSRTR
ncbi:MAG: nicotinamide riboside transporter PnuC [Candidatus Planktophila sp.]